ncbi:zinc-binding dehydrogenase [Streptomyces sp. MP131-18]|uniref:zinc-binding dehydrogenase n=1 Tax=Streptomyces sp. MP131-18 TaxID=1857892 RepID=UPI0015C545FF|nr:zinc-binding dehydrogenase [Streptomyces sp. MP131-18]
MRTAAAGICASDVQVLDGRMAGQVPAVLGHEAAGVVEDVGEDVARLRRGDRVLICQSSHCGACEQCLKGHPSLCRSPGLRTRADGTPRVTARGETVHLGSGIGAFSELMLVHERAAVPLPEAVPARTATMLGCAVTTGIGAVLRTAGVPAGATVAVVGAGAIGLSCVQGARLTGAARIVAVDQQAQRLRTALDFGATDTVLAGGDDVVEAVKELTDGGVEYAFEAVGRAVTVEQSFRMLRMGGVCTVIGIVPKSTPITLKASALLAERRLQGSANGSNRFHLDVPRYLALYEQGRLKLDEMIGAAVPLAEIGRGIEATRERRHTRTVVSFDGCAVGGPAGDAA